jgi:PKD repeat protein
MKSCRLALAIVLTQCICLAENSPAQEKSEQSKQLEIIPAPGEYSTFLGDRRVSIETGGPLAVYRIDYPVNAASPQAMATQYLRENANALHLDAELRDLKFVSSRETPGGYRVRFEQYIAGYRVYKSAVTVSINRENRVVFLMNGHKEQVGVPALQKRALPSVPSTILSSQRALQKAKAHLGITAQPYLEKNETVWYYNGEKFRLALKSDIISTDTPRGAWEVLADAETGEIFRIEDRAFYDRPSSITSPESVDGRGWVFDPDPISTARTVYGAPGFTHNNDADSDSLTAQLRVRTLPGITIDPATGKYVLRGPYAQIVDVELPYTGLHENDSANFNFTRSNDNFEAVMCYYHIDKSMRYLNDTLGYHVMPLQHPGGVMFDPHGCKNVDNAWYIYDHIAFGSPASNVDAAEDGVTVWHELGHMIHDWITGLSASTIEGVSEGSADYWGQSYVRSFHCFTPSDQQYDWLFLWGYYGGAPCLRVTNYGAHYPEGLTGGIHMDGQMWSSSLMSIYDVIGRTATDRLFLEALSMTDCNSTQRDLALAFMQADRDLYGGSHLSSISTVFSNRGYLMGSVTGRIGADVTGGPAPLTVHFKDLSLSYPGAITSWKWDMNNDGVIDATSQNPSFTYTAQGLYSVKLIVSDGSDIDTVVVNDYVSVNKGNFVFDGLRNGSDYSGKFIYDGLISMGLSAVYTRNPRLPSSLLGYDACYISMGTVYDGDYDQITETYMDSASCLILADYLRHGGRLYVEGAEAWGVYPFNNHEVHNLLGIASVDVDLTLGTTWAPLAEMDGQSGSIAEGLHFTSSSQSSSLFIDRFTPNAYGRVAFVRAGYGNVAIQGSGVYGQRSFCMSYALSKINGMTSPNTRVDLLGRIARFLSSHDGPCIWARPSIDCGTLSIGSRGDTSKVTLYSAGTAPLEIRSISDPHSPFSVLKPDEVMTVNQGGSITFTLIFKPTISGLMEDSTRVTSSDTVRPEIVIKLKGKCVGEQNVAAPFVMYAVQGRSDSAYLGTLSLQTGELTPCASLRVPSLQGMSIRPGTGKMYGVSGGSTSASLYCIDALTGELAYVMRWPIATVRALAFRNQDSMYVGTYAGELYLASLSTGSITKIGTSTVRYSSFTFNPQTGQLWASAALYNDSLYTVDIFTGAAVSKGSTGLRVGMIMAADNTGTLYALTGDVNNLFRINPHTLQPEPVGSGTRSGYCAAAIRLDKVTGDPRGGQSSPTIFGLEQNYPNPFNPKTGIRIQVPEISHVRLVVYDLLGSEVAVLLDEQKAPGRYQVEFDGTTFSSGVYFYRLTAGVYVESKRMLLLK